jgi:hypothetical protein
MRRNTTFGTVVRSTGQGVPIITADTAARLLADEDTERRKDQALGDAMLARRVEPELFEDARDDTPERLMPEGVIDEPGGEHP